MDFHLFHLELHVFADAPSCAYRTITYFSFIQEHNVKCMFTASKSRLVPLSQKPRIPRLELQAEVIATRFKNTIVNEIPIEKRNRFLWTDSKIVLNYLNNNDTNFGVYITHRINEIRQSTDPDNWRYIKTEQNPADHITRYQDFLSLSKNDSSIFGPSFLKEKPCFEMSNNNIIVQTQQSNTQNKSHNSFINNTYPEIKWSYYSYLDKLIRAISWIKKLKSNWIKWKRGEQTRENFNIITAAEFRDSQHEFIRLSQNTSFKEEINNLKPEKHAKSSSSIGPLSSSINSAGLLCIGGRLKAVNIRPNFKHRILISKHHPIAKLLITDIYSNYTHCGREYNLCMLRQNCWIPANRGLIRKILSNCSFCKRQNAKPVLSQIENLSNICLQSHVKPFSNTGVDYFGPIQAKTSRKTRRNQGGIKSLWSYFNMS